MGIPMCAKSGGIYFRDMRELVLWYAETNKVIHEGLQARREGKIRPLSEVLREIGIGAG